MRHASFIVESLRCPSMAAWRTKAYEIFGFEPGSYSYCHGVVALLSDLREMASNAARAGDDAALDRVAAYVRWAAAQPANSALGSAVDLGFFLPALRDPILWTRLEGRLPRELLSEKRRLLMAEPPKPE